MTPGARGRLAALAGVVALSPDAVLVRLIDTDPWSLLAWRGIAMAIVLLGALAVMQGAGRVMASLRALDGALWGAALCVVTGSAGFVAAITYASAATALIIVATGPIFSAIASRVLLGERASGRLMLAIAIGLAGTVIAASGEGGAGGSAPALGIAMGFLCAASLGLQLTLLRRAKESENLVSMGAGSLLLGIFGVALGAPAAFSGAQMGYALLMGAVFVPVAFALITYAPRFIPSAEVALILLLEAPLGALWVWLAIDEAPTVQAMAGGVLVLTALVIITTRRATTALP